MFTRHVSTNSKISRSRFKLNIEKKNTNRSVVFCFCPFFLLFTMDLFFSPTCISKLDVDFYGL